MDIEHIILSKLALVCNSYFTRMHKQADWKSSY
jgi:hypothetical protein